MDDIPERIWAGPTDKFDWLHGTCSNVLQGVSGSEFVRSDLFDSLVEENNRLRETLRMIDAVVYNDNGDVTYDTQTMAKAHRLALEALKG